MEYFQAIFARNSFCIALGQSRRKIQIQSYQGKPKIKKITVAPVAKTCHQEQKRKTDNASNDEFTKVSQKLAQNVLRQVQRVKHVAQYSQMQTVMGKVTPVKNIQLTEQFQTIKKQQNRLTQQQSLFQTAKKQIQLERQSLAYHENQHVQQKQRFDQKHAKISRACEFIRRQTNLLQQQVRVLKKAALSTFQQPRLHIFLMTCLQPNSRKTLKNYSIDSRQVTSLYFPNKQPVPSGTAVILTSHRPQLMATLQAFCRQHKFVFEQKKADQFIIRREQAKDGLLVSVAGLQSAVCVEEVRLCYWM